MKAKKSLHVLICILCISAFAFVPGFVVAQDDRISEVTDSTAQPTDTRQDQRDQFDPTNVPPEGPVVIATTPPLNLYVAPRAPVIPNAPLVQQGGSGGNNNIPKPDKNIVELVLAQTNGAQFTPINAPNGVVAQAQAFGGVFAGLSYDTVQSVNYFDAAGTLRESLIPLVSSGTASLIPNMTTPGIDSRPGRILGISFQPAHGVSVVVAIFPTSAAGCTTGCPQPTALRFFTSGTGYSDRAISQAAFYDNDGNFQADPIDQGAIIAHDLSCFTVGLDQACYSPPNVSVYRDPTTPQAAIATAVALLDSYYDLKTDFFINDAVPDLLGQSQRNACAAQLAIALTFNNLSSCAANSVIGAADTLKDKEPIAILVVTSPANIRTFNTSGTYIGDLPAGTYLVLHGEKKPDPGAPTVLFLVNANGVNHYYIASTVMDGTAPHAGREPYRAAIKDGYSSYRAFGW